MTETFDFDAVIVGSGFGGSTVACRLAEAGRRVCVLERGRPFPPNSFPRSPEGIARNLWDPDRGRFGMYDIWAFRGIESLVSSGLGGGSLIYANVMIRKDPAWFVDDDPAGGNRPWPVSYDDLEPHYVAAEEVLGATPYPFDTAPYSSTPKTVALRDAARQLGLDWRLPNLAVSFANGDNPPVPGERIDEPFPNVHNRQRETCRLCGECDVGCNYGSKNTLDYTYLSRAAHSGAEIRTLAEVERIDPIDGGYRITYLAHDTENPRPRAMVPRVVLHAKRLVLGAGTFGSTYLLLRNRAALPHLSPALGTRFSGNGDLLTFFLRDGRSDTKGRTDTSSLAPELGPVITSAIRVGDTLDGNGPVGRGFYIEDGGVPSFLDWLVDVAGAPSMAGRAAAFAVRRTWAHLRGRPRSNLTADVARVVGGRSTAAGTLPMLTMGRDIPDGVMSLRGGDLDLQWSTRNSAEYFARVERTVGALADALGARLANTPLWLFKRVITVHPLGGNPMGEHPDVGVVDAWGEVWNYPGLFVVDGSVMRGPVGPNPSLTIAAFAERAAAHMLEGTTP